jgi:hypothetical protein
MDERLFVCLVLDLNAVTSAVFQWIQQLGAEFEYKRVFDVFFHDRGAEFCPRLNLMGVVPRFPPFVVLGASRHSRYAKTRWKNKGRQKGRKAVYAEFFFQLCLEARIGELIPFLVPLLAGLDLFRSELGLFLGHSEVFIENVKRLELVDAPDKIFHFRERVQRSKGLRSGAVQYRSDTQYCVCAFVSCCVVFERFAAQLWVMGPSSLRKSEFEYLYAVVCMYCT